MILTTNMKPPEIKIIPQETEDYKYDFKNYKRTDSGKESIGNSGCRNAQYVNDGKSGSRKIHYSKKQCHPYFLI